MLHQQVERGAGMSVTLFLDKQPPWKTVSRRGGNDKPAA
jgi:hypothetical protein